MWDVQGTYHLLPALGLTLCFQTLMPAAQGAAGHAAPGFRTQKAVCGVARLGTASLGTPTLNLLGWRPRGLLGWPCCAKPGQDQGPFPDLGAGTGQGLRAEARGRLLRPRIRPADPAPLPDRSSIG